MSQKVIVREWLIEFHDYSRKEYSAFDFTTMTNPVVATVGGRLGIEWVSPEGEEGSVTSWPGKRFVALAPLVERRLAITDIAAAREDARSRAVEQDRSEREALERSKNTPKQEWDSATSQAASQEKRRRNLIWCGAAVAVAVIAYFAVAIATDEGRPNPTGGSSCSTNSDSFVVHLRNDGPTSGAAASYRAQGFLVNGDGDGGACVYEDR